jgi:DNA polymerase-3 subunit gamma/tau
VNHLVLARKYRPQRFGDLVGQDPVRTTLERAVATNRTAHAYLFAGPRGSGKTTTARLLAKALNCANRRDGEAEPCNQCPSCAEITAGTSMDVLEIDGASNRGIEEIRNLRENVKYAPSGGKSKVYIIDEAHQLTDFAWNALLKTLEEPPAHVRFVFATTEPLDIPETIASRCQVFEFRRLRSQELVGHLLAIAKAEKVALAEDAAALIARAAEGSVRDALSRLDQALALAPDGVTAESVATALGLAGLEAYFELADAIVARDAKRALEILDQLYDRGLDVEEVSDGLTHHLRQLLLLAVDRSLERLVDAAPADRERYAAQAASLDANDASAMLALLLEARTLLRRAEAPRVVLEVCLLELCTLPSASRIESLIERLESIESRLGGGRPPEPAPGPRSAAAPAKGSASASSTRAPAKGSATASSTRTPGPAPKVEATRSPGPPPSAAGPAPEASAIQPATEGDPVVRWRKAVDRVKDRKLLLGTCLEEGLFLGLTGSNVRIALSSDHSFHRAMLELKENREILNQELEHLYGRGATLVCVSGEAAIAARGSSAESAAIDRAAAELAEGRDADGPPGPGLVQRIVDLFDGEILDPGPQGSRAS